MNLSPQILTPAAIDPSSPVLPPTRQETHHLTSLVPFHAQTSSKSVSQAVSAVFNICRHRWVTDFLFSKHMTPLSALTAPVNLNHSVTCAVTMTSVERLNGLPRSAHAPSNPFDIHMHGDYAFVPAFSVGPISVGFGIQNCATKCHADWSLHPGQRHNTALGHFRFVRDDDKGILLIIREASDDFYKIDYMHHQTTKKRSRNFLVVGRTAVQNLLNDDPGGLDPLKLVTAIRLIQCAEEFRDCPICGQSKNASCNCKLQFMTPKHPLDFASMVINMGSYLGSFEGVTDAKFCTAGMELLSAKLGSRISIDCKNDTDLLDRMSRWAIADQLSTVKEDLWKSIMPPADERMTNTPSGVVGNREVAEIGVDDEMTEDDMHAVVEVDAFDDEVTQLTKGACYGDAVTGGSDVLPTYEKFERFSPSSTGEEDVQLTDEITREAQLAYHAENGIGEHSAPSGTSTIVVRGSDTYDLREGDIYDDVQPSEEERLRQEKEQRAESRRQRNRLAAQRSNAKRKEKNDTLKAELHASHSKAAELRARELVLREENIRLRKMLSSS